LIVLPQLVAGGVAVVDAGGAGVGDGVGAAGPPQAFPIAPVMHH